MITDEFEQLMIVENLYNKGKVKILCLLQNAWGDRPLPLIFKPNRGNKSAKTMRKVCGENIMHFGNTTGIVTTTAAGKAAADKEWLSNVLEKAKRYDILIVCGKQAKEAFDTATQRQFPISVLIMPHPASRTLTNILLAEAARFVGRRNSFKYVELKEVKGGKFTVTKLT